VLQTLLLLQNGEDGGDGDLVKQAIVMLLLLLLLLMLLLMRLMPGQCPRGLPVDDAGAATLLHGPGPAVDTFSHPQPQVVPSHSQEDGGGARQWLA
jgi:hypothetical protein